MRELLFQCIACASFSCRVAVLVREGKFEEAEQLVHEHHLDPEVNRTPLCVLYQLIFVSL